MDDREDLIEAAVRKLEHLRDAGIEQVGLPPDGRTQGLMEIAGAVKVCTRCSLSATRKNAVPGRGGARAGVLFVGGPPTGEEEAEGRPFAGETGALLDRIVVSMGLKDASGVYLTGIVKCRPPGDREAGAEELSACLEHLNSELGLIRPLVVVALGDAAARALLREGKGVSELRGRFHSAQVKDMTVKVMPTYHPSSLLREPHLKKEAWDDIKAVMAELRASGLLPGG